jgi:hypothetical protein
MTFSLRLRSSGTILFYCRKGTEFEGERKRKLRQWWKSPERPETALLVWGSHRLGSEFVTFSKLPKIDAANKVVTTTQSSKIQERHKLSGQALALLGMTRSKGVSSASHQSSERSGGD